MSRNNKSPRKKGKYNNSDQRPQIHRTTTYSATSITPRNGKKLRIAFFGDFCYPRKGGVENHQWALAQELIRRGHKLIAITNTYYDKDKGTRQGIRWMSNGLKIYYTPIRPIFDQNSLPILWFFAPLIRHILIREAIDIVHYHAASAFMTISCSASIGAMGIRSVYTDHSLFPFSDSMYVHINKGNKCGLTETDQFIAVSHICKENLILRACLDPNDVNVIPNAVDTTKFRPPPQQRRDGRIVVVMITRMAFRKGIHLAVQVIPGICRKFKNVDFVIGGDGPTKVLSSLSVPFMIYRRTMEAALSTGCARLASIQFDDPFPVVTYRGDRGTQTIVILVTF